MTFKNDAEGISGGVSALWRGRGHLHASPGPCTISAQEPSSQLVSGTVGK